jgi:hypothetical protein
MFGDEHVGRRERDVCWWGVEIVNEKAAIRERSGRQGRA